MTSSSYNDREQTRVKHEVLHRYLSAFVPIVGDWAADIAYIDCLAGPWKSVDPKLADTSFGHAIDVLRSTKKVLKARGKSPNMRCLFVEKSPAAFARLREFCSDIRDIEVTTHNWDFCRHIADVVRFAKGRRESFPFIFIDPKGWEQLEIELIKPILALTPGEVLITFMTSWITRFLSDKTKHFDRLFGTDWQRLLTLEGEELEDEIVNSYRHAIRVAGRFNYVCSLPVMKANQDAFQFFMIYATRHPRGIEVFKETEKYVIPFMHETRAQAQERNRFQRTGQHGLFEPGSSYKESKFTRYVARSLQRAEADLKARLQELGSLSYSDAWATVMQHSAITEPAFRKLVNDLKKRGLIQLSQGRRPNLTCVPNDH